MYTTDPWQLYAIVFRVNELGIDGDAQSVTSKCHHTATTSTNTVMMMTSNILRNLFIALKPTKFA